MEIWLHLQILCFATAQMANLPTQSHPLYIHHDVVITVLRYYSCASVSHECTVQYLVLGLCGATWLKRGASWSWCSPRSWCVCTTKNSGEKEKKKLFNSGWNCDDSEVVWINWVDMSGQGGEMETCIFMHVCMCIWCVYCMCVTYFPSWFLDRSKVRSWEHFHLFGAGKLEIWFPQSFRQTMAWRNHTHTHTNYCNWDCQSLHRNTQCVSKCL